MAAEVTYGFYSQVYGGGLSEAAFGDSLPVALRLLRRMRDGKPLDAKVYLQAGARMHSARDTV